LTDDDEAALQRAESERCRAISELDLAALDRLLTDELSHTHATGVTQDKAGYLAGLGGRPRQTTRRDLQIRVYGDTAVMTGVLVNSFPASEQAPARVSELHALQVWVRRPGGWQQAAFAASGRG
jgi:ketosteroid isomerase-like protein